MPFCKDCQLFMQKFQAPYIFLCIQFCITSRILVNPSLSEKAVLQQAKLFHERNFLLEIPQYTYTYICTYINYSCTGNKLSAAAVKHLY